jgi:hypothetical protein
MTAKLNYIGGIILFRSLQIFQNELLRNYSDKRKRNLELKNADN